MIVDGNSSFYNIHRDKVMESVGLNMVRELLGHSDLK